MLTQAGGMRGEAKVRELRKGGNALFLLISEVAI